MKPLVTKLGTALRKTVGREVDIVQGPFVLPALGGLRPTMFVAIASFQDEGALTVGGARTVRWPIPGGKKGYIEERPGRVAVSIDCMALSYAAVQKYCTAVAPAALAALEAVTSVSFGATPEKDCTLEFRDFSVSLHSLTFQVEPDEHRPFSRGTVVFHLDGFLRIQVQRGKMRDMSRAKKRVKEKG